jgi:type IV secretory pathway VirD2 relaxase
MQNFPKVLSSRAFHAAFKDFGRYGKMQRVVVKATYSSPKSLNRHLQYIQREGVGLDGRKPELFAPAKQEQLPTQAIDGEQRFFRFILSPEHGDRIEAQKDGMQQFTRDFMQRLEQETGRKLQWCAAVHYNTDNPHAHIVIRGKDADGLDVRFPRYIFKSKAREMAQELATAWLGLRTPEEIRAQLSREVVSPRLTSIDKGILARVDELGNFIPLNALQQARAERLVNLGLAQKYGKDFYMLNPDWDKTLRANGEKDDIIKNIYNEQPKGIRKKFDLDNTSQHKFNFYDKAWTVKGKIAASGLTDELSEKPYVVVQTPADAANRYRSELYYYASHNLKFSQLKPGQEVMLEKGTLRFGQNLESTKEPWQTRKQQAPRIQSDLYHAIALGDKDGVLRAIQKDLSPELKEHWAKHNIQTRPMTFYKPSFERSAEGRIVASGTVEPLALTNADYTKGFTSESKIPYVLIESTSGVKSPRLWLYTDTSLEQKKLVPLSTIRISRGELLTQDDVRSRDMRHYESLRNVRGIKGCIYDSLSPEQQRQWTEKKTLQGKLFFCDGYTNASGRVLSKGVMKSPDGTGRTYLLLESNMGHARALHFYSSTSLAADKFTSGDTVRISKGQAISQIEQLKISPSPSLGSRLRECIVQGDKKGALQAIYEDLSPRLRGRWDKSGLLNKPYSTYLITQAIEGEVVGKGNVATNLGSIRPYVLIETKRGQLFYYSSSSIELDKLPDGAQATLRAGKMSSVDEKGQRIEHRRSYRMTM